jgi:hypothetical protein
MINIFKWFVCLFRGYHRVTNAEGTWDGECADCGVEI